MTDKYKVEEIDMKDKKHSSVAVVILLGAIRFADPTFKALIKLSPEEANKALVAETYNMLDKMGYSIVEKIPSVFAEGMSEPAKGDNASS